MLRDSEVCEVIYMKEAFVGFDSAWGVNTIGAIAYAVFQDNVLVKVPAPRVADFADAAEIIKILQGECDHVLIAIDQPIIVPNDEGQRPVDSVADAIMQQLNSSALKANRTEKRLQTKKQRGFNNKYLLGDEAPVWKFMSKIGPCGYFGKTDRCDMRAFVDFEAALKPSGNTHVIEVYPALALAALAPTFMDRKSAARHNPESKNREYPFSLEDWRLVCEIVHRGSVEHDLVALAQWATEMIDPWDSPAKPRKRHQDKLDAAICLIIALQWRRVQYRSQLLAIGDLDHGYIVTPVSDTTRQIIETACRDQNVDLR